MKWPGLLATGSESFLPETNHANLDLVGAKNLSLRFILGKNDKLGFANQDVARLFLMAGGQPIKP